jgi:predicted anti-sigma-YlaC factor YlaD
MSGSYSTVLARASVRNSMDISVAGDPGPAPGRISCSEFVEIVTEYLDGAMPPRLRARFEAHLEGCKGCDAYFEQMRQTLRLVDVLRKDAVRLSGRDRLLDAFRSWRAGHRADT